MPPILVKYTKNKNTKRPSGTLSVYLESIDPARLRTFLGVENNAISDKIIKEVTPGTFIGNMKTYQVINGIGNNNPLTLSDSTIESNAAIWVKLIMEGVGQKPSEDTLLADLGCPPPPPPTVCPSCPPPPSPTVCPPEKICPTPEPCPSCPLWDPSKKAPTGNDIQIFSNTGVTNRARILPALAELIRVRLAFVGKTANFRYPTANTGTNGVNKNTIRIKFKTYNKKFAFPTTDATTRKFVDTIVADLTPLLA
jgi:hypothetical protein